MGEYKDLRFKLTIDQKAEIRNRYESGQKNRGLLASEYGVSLGTINFIVNPSILEKHKSRKVGSWKKYYTTEKARKWMSDFRARRKATV
jgi:hypothetical protein